MSHNFRNYLRQSLNESHQTMNRSTNLSRRSNKRRGLHESGDIWIEGVSPFFDKLFGGDGIPDDDDKVIPIIWVIGGIIAIIIGSLGGGGNNTGDGDQGKGTGEDTQTDERRQSSVSNYNPFA